MEATRGQLRKGCQTLAQVGLEPLQLRYPWLTRAVGRRFQTLRDVSTHCLAVEPRPAGDGRDADALAMQFKDHDDLPKSDQRHAPTVEKGTSLLISADCFPGSCQLTPSAQLGNFQPALLGNIQPALTIVSRPRSAPRFCASGNSDQDGICARRWPSTRSRRCSPRRTVSILSSSTICCAGSAKLWSASHPRCALVQGFRPLGKIRS